MRQAMRAMSERKWDELVERARSNLLPNGARLDRDNAKTYSGDVVLLTGVDPSRQSGDKGERVLMHRDDRAFWAMEMDKGAQALVSALRQAQTELGFAPAGEWEVVARLDRVDWTAACYDETRDDCPFLLPLGLRVPGQLAVFKHPKRGPVVPGMASAKSELGRLRQDDAVDLSGQPDQLVEVLSVALATHDQALYARLWNDDVGSSSLRYSFNQFLKAYAACEGRMAFERYDARQCPENFPDQVDRVKLFVSRDNNDGTTTSRPLTWRHDGQRWRIDSGTL